MLQHRSNARQKASYLAMGFCLLWIATSVDLLLSRQSQTFYCFVGKAEPDACRHGQGSGIRRGAVHPHQQDVEFHDAVKGTVPIVVDFTNTWCGPCRMMNKILEDLKQDFSPHVEFLKIEVDKNSALAGTYKIRGVPTVMLFPAGSSEPAKIFVGVASREKISSAIKIKLLSSR
mmetsp:Transcript_34735/g.64646  ORF Transcript_34735/g.64646 Transcript_34735/m.64646 type:complete len:174 (+) Transcript_34735:81-602(+)